ncbi:M28 family peptidase [Skermania sp. ID1734]|uniref:M28 family peptidase n=1 Tax=Skermania sp. ID1734 TaxID=2597516 RepID=UPI00117D76B8|nr:M28 family peptidase [Skermania sp. ID1734]TSD99395.1 M28 family peptidase [Skermania sp. ID1734]
MRVGRVAVAGLLVCGLAVACGSEPNRSISADAVAAGITQDALGADLHDLQRIADQHDGNRSVATAGYDASVDYIATKLRKRGFDVQTPEFDVSDFRVGTHSLVVDGRLVPVDAVAYSPPTPDQGIDAPIVAAAGNGCDARDYDGVSGSIALVQRGVCTFAQKQRVAAAQGALAVIVVNASDDPLGEATLGEDRGGKIPIVGVRRSDGAGLSGSARLVLQTETTTMRSRNVIAQTKTGSTENVVMAGAHLDSVPQGPGINDNGTGTAAILETALEMGPSPPVANAVRFAWWGAEERGLIGSDAYVDGLTSAQRLDIALYLNFDMLGSPNPGYLTYDGDDSDHQGAPAGPQGSAGIERTLNGYLKRAGFQPDGTDFDGRSDYGAFIEHGIPAGGVFSGAEERKSPAQAAKWGGKADEPFDPNYHSAKDTVGSVDMAEFQRNARAAAYGIALYSLAIDGPDGVPGHSDRARVRGNVA